MKSGKRRKARELVLQMLFQSDMGQQNYDQVRKTFWTERSNVDDETRAFADGLFRVAEDQGSRIKELIEQHAPRWSMDRMAAVDRNVIRTGVAEFLGYSTPRAIVVNEALEITRKYSSDDSVHFINGVLDSVGKALGRK
jgi:transcription antitermination protein NusB